MASPRSLPQRLIPDSGGVLGWSRSDARIRTILRQAIARQLELRIPVVVLAETLRGGPRDAPVNRVLKAVGAEPTAPATGRDAGKLLGRTGGTNTADALVAPRPWLYPAPSS